MNKLLTLLAVLPLASISLHAETQTEWQCKMAMEEYQILRQQALTQGSKCAHIENISSRLACKSGESLSGPVRRKKEAQRLQAYEQWISQNCF